MGDIYSAMRYETYGDIISYHIYGSESILNNVPYFVIASIVLRRKEGPGIIIRCPTTTTGGRILAIYDPPKAGFLAKIPESGP